MEHVVVPHRHARLLEAERIQPLADVEKPLQRRPGREVAAELFLIDVVALLADPLAVVEDVPALDIGLLDREPGHLRFLLREDAEVAQLGLGDRGLHLVEERRHRLGIADHAPLRHVMREARHIVELGDFLPQRHDLVEDLDVAGCAAVRVGEVVAPPRLLVLRVHHERDVVGIVEADEDVAVVVLLNALQVRRRQSVALRRGEAQHALVLADVLAELLRQLREPLGDDAEALPFFGREGNAAVLEGLEEVLPVLPLRDRRRRHAAHALVERLVLEQLRHEDRLVDDDAVGGVAHGGVGMDAVEQPDRTEGVLDGDRHRVPGVEHGLGRESLQRQCLDRRHALARLGQRTRGGPAQLLGAVNWDRRPLADCRGIGHGRGILCHPSNLPQQITYKVACDSLL